MISYPTRAQVTPRAYRDQCVNGEVWQLIDSISKGNLFLAFTPGGLALGTVGFLGNFPGLALILFLQFTTFQNEPIDFRGYFVVIGILGVVLTHGVLMLRVLLGQVYAQQDLLLYLKLMLATCCGFTAFALVKGLSFSDTIFPLAATALAAFLFWLSRSVSFTLFAEIMRVKLIYLKERDEKRRMLQKKTNGGR